MIAKKEGAITKLRKEAPEAAKCKECANASHEREVNGERPPCTFSFSHLTSIISACRISAAGVARCFLFCDASIGSFHPYEAAGISSIYQLGGIFSVERPSALQCILLVVGTACSSLWSAGGAK